MDGKFHNIDSFAGGNPVYFSPEQGASFDLLLEKCTDERAYQVFLSASPAVTSKSDIYSFGLIMLEILKGFRNWFRGDKIGHMMADLKKISGTPDPEPPSWIMKSVYQKLVRLTILCIGQRLEDRANTIWEVHERLVQIYAEEKDFGLLWEPYYDEAEFSESSLNNRAVGFYWINRFDKAMKLWEASLKFQNNLPTSSNLFSIFNYGVAKSLRGESTDIATLRYLNNQPESNTRNFLILLIHLKLSQVYDASKPFSFSLGLH